MKKPKWMRERDRKLSAEFDHKFPKELLNAPVAFGLEAQGHVQTIKTCLYVGMTWKQIGDVIGWCPDTAKQHYEWYLEKETAVADLPIGFAYHPSETIRKAIGDLADAVQKEHRLNNGRTAMYWNLLAVVGSHVKERE